MKSNRPTTDGFVPRRTGSQLGEFHTERRPQAQTRPIVRDLRTDESSIQNVGRSRQGMAVGRSDIDESLREIDDNSFNKSKRFGRRKSGLIKSPKKKRSRTRRIIKWVLWLLVLLAVGVGAYMGWKIITAGGSIFKGSVFDIVQNQALKQDSNGRSNFLILGTSEDDPGHGGAYLTDSMMILSIDQTNKNAYMFSIPRDLYVQYSRACNSGYAGKINEYFNCVNDDYTTDSAEQQRLTESQKFVGDIFGIDVQYGIHVNNTVIKDAVDAVGGVDVDIEGSNGDPGILDRNFDWRCNYKCNLVKYTNGVNHLDGAHALYLSMARGDIAPTYGLGNSNFDREKNQQKIIIALKDKAATTGTLTNVGKVTGLIDALGKNLRTNIQTKEIRTLMQLGSDISSTNIHMISLQDADKSVVKSGNYNGASVVMPSAGMFDYTDIRSYIKQQLSSNPVTREDSSIVVLNGSDTSGVGQTQATILQDKGFIVGTVDNAPAGKYSAVEIYVVDASKTATLNALKVLYSNAVIKTTAPPLAISGNTGFVIVIGS
jgi:LCP family protein required for cell wall assembly